MMMQRILPTVSLALLLAAQGPAALGKPPTAPKPAAGQPSTSQPTEQAPVYLPIRDVAVQYRVSGKAASQVRELQVRYSAIRQLLRVETEDRGMGFLLVDPVRRSARMVVPGLGQAMDLPLARDRRAALLFGDGLQFTKRGRSKVAGRECTNWDVRADRDTATLCLTREGVLLRAAGHSGDMADSTLEAMRVDDAPQAAGLFQVPSGGRGLNLDALRPFLQGR